MKPANKVLTIGAILIVIFGVSFFFFYKRGRKKDPPALAFVASRVINQRLPKTNLVSPSGQPLDDETLRHGKIVLAIMMPDCGPCDQENEFLKTVIDSRKDVRFVYLIPFGNKNALLKLGQNKYALEPVYDNGSNVAKTLEINQVPIKLFLEEGIIRRTWVDATVTSEKQTEFRNWLREL